MDQTAEKVPYIYNTYLTSFNLSQSNSEFLLFFANEKLYKAGAYPGHVAELPKAFKTASEIAATGKVGISAVYKDPYGEWMSLLYPIRLGEGVDCVFGMDIDYKSFQEIIQKKALEIVTYLILFSCIIFGVLIYFINLLFAPIRRIVSLVDEIDLQKEILPEKFNYERQDEYKTFYSKIKKLLEKIFIYEQELKKQVARQKTNVIEKISETSKRISELSSQMRVNGKEISESSLQTEKSITELKKLIQENSSKMQKILESSQNLNSHNQKSQSELQKGIKSISEILKELASIRNSAQIIQEFSENLNHSLREIGTIMLTLSRIS